MNGLVKNILDLYNSFMVTLPNWAQNFITLFLLVVMIVLYSVFIWKFYRFIAKKNLLELDLKKYSQVEHPVLAKLLVGALYLLEYIVISPFVIFFWFGVFTVFLIFLTENLNLSALLILSATIVAAIRMTSYYKEDLAKDLAKLLPFTLLATSLLNPNFFSIERIASHLTTIPGFFGDIVYYLFFIIILEIVLRFFEFIFSLFEVEEIPIKEE